MVANLDVIVSVMAVGGQIALGVVAAARLRRSPTAGPLLALAVTMALWTLTARANRMHLDRMVLATLWPLGSALHDRRAEAERLVFLGRVSDQLAHDVRNPLSAIVGAADFLRVEWHNTLLEHQIET